MKKPKRTRFIATITYDVLQFEGNEAPTVKYEKDFWKGQVSSWEDGGEAKIKSIDVKEVK